MAGHSHWSQIKRAKGANDLKRGQLFSKLSREITVSVRLGGPDPNFNFRLRSAITAAKAESMPADNIDRAIKKGAGESGGEQLEELVYEGYAPGGVAILAEAMTDNKNRTAAEIRALFTKHGGNLAGSGSVAWMFHKKGVFLVENATEDAVLEAALDAGAEDIAATPAGIEVFCPPEHFDAVDKALAAAGLKAARAQLTYRGENPTPLHEEAAVRQVLDLVEKLEEHDDVQAVYANYSLSQELLAKGEL
jgi:YebC/PmpR family DNA-binding regulatory protein